MRYEHNEAVSRPEVEIASSLRDSQRHDGAMRRQIP
jgi:hypothetical protein